MVKERKPNLKRRDVVRGENPVVPPDPDNNLGRGAPADREERVQQRAHDKARSLDGNPQFRDRQAHDLDREDTDLHREGAADEKPGVRLTKEEVKAKS